MTSIATISSNTQNDVLMRNLMEFYVDKENIHKMMNIINGESKISLRIVDWFVTNFAKKYYTVYDLQIQRNNGQIEHTRFKVYNDYKLKLKAYSKKRFDPFCRWDRISIPYDEEKYMETTIGQLNFFKWAIENNIIDFIKANYEEIENDMNARNSTSKRKYSIDNKETIWTNDKTRKKREELSVSACKCIKKESVKIIVKFN
jgi:sporulation protein YlmC with PRC-barrel domain